MADAVLRDVWFGIAEKSGGHLIAAGVESTVGQIFNVTSPSWNSTFAIENIRLGPGLGGTLFGATVVIVLNCHSLFTLNGTDVSDWGFNFGIGAKWSGLLKFWQAAGLFKTVQEMRAAVKTAQNIQAVVTPKNAEVIKASVNYFWNSYDMANSTKPTIVTLDVPGTGWSAEISLSIMQGKFSIL